MSPRTDDPVQEQLIQARRSQILDAAVKVFAEKGFHRATIRDVANAAGVADGTIYNYFENKTAVLLGILDRMNQTDQRARDFEMAEQVGMREFLQRYLRYRYQIISANQFEVFQIALAELFVNKELRELYYARTIEPNYILTEKLLVDLVNAGVIKPFDIGLWMRMISASTIGFMVLHILGDTEVQQRWDELPDFLANFVISNIEFTAGEDS